MTLQSRLLGLIWLVLLSSLLLCVSAHAEEDSRWQVTPNVNDIVDWNIQPDSTALAKAMNDAAEHVQRFQPPGTVEEWEYRRPQVEAALRRAIGLEQLPERTPLNSRTVAKHDMGDYFLENVIFESRPNFPVTANLYRPKGGPAKKPAMLCPIGHLLDAGKAGTQVQARCIKLAKMGFVVLVYDAIGHGERLIRGNIHHEGQYALLPVGETIAGWMAWDSMRGIDYLVGLPEVDPKRIGVTGNSGGGLAALYTVALEPRAAAATVAGYTFQFANWMKYAGAHGSCSQLISIFRHMEWFEVAGLFAPRPLQMLQGERDGIFPISGARKAGYATEALYTVLGHGDLARLDVVPKLGHAYSKPFRERMYGWMALHLQNVGDGSPLPEGEITTLPEDDPRLLCDPDGTVMSKSSSVVDLAQEKAKEAVAELGKKPLPKDWVTEFTAPPFREPHNLMPRLVDSTENASGRFEKVYFVSEIGQHIPGLLWVPKDPKDTIIIVDDRGKSAVAESDLIEPLVTAGFAVLSIDLRGRGETLGKWGNNRDNNYHFVLHSIMWGQPPAGRRAFDLTRAIDYVFRRDDLPKKNVALVGLGDEALPALLAAASEERIKRLVCADFYSSFISPMISAALHTREELVGRWNVNANYLGRIQGDDFRIDLGSVIPRVLEHGDIPELVSLVSPRQVLYCQTRDKDSGHETRFRSVTAGSEGWLQFKPDEALTVEMLVNWLE